MSNDNPDAATPTRGSGATTRLIAIACVSSGLLIVTGGLLLAARWLVIGDVVALLVGLLLLLLGIVATATGVVLFYRRVSATTKDSRKTRATL